MYVSYKKRVLRIINLTHYREHTNALFLKKKTWKFD